MFGNNWVTRSISFWMEDPASGSGIHDPLFFKGKPRFLRPGGVPLEEIESIIGKVEMSSEPEEAKPLLLPGSYPEHYAPRTPIVIEGWRENIDLYQNKKVGLLPFGE